MATVFAAAIAALSAEAVADKSPYDWAFVRLDYARQEKVGQLRSFCESVHQKASEACEDDAIVEFFDVNLKYSHLRRDAGKVPEALEERIGELHEAIVQHYMRHYLCFYDILCVDSAGDIFYTLRKDADCKQNVFAGSLGSSPLALCLRSDPREEVFIDFHYYASSDEPAAFFVEPLYKNGERLGWLVLQCAINKLNSLFAGVEELGPTGETFLVNHDGYMLSESNFQGDSTILKRRLDDQNISAKFEERKGHRVVTDYRGHTALTSFEVVDFLGSQRLVVAKVDEAQIITEHFWRHRQYYYDRIGRHLLNSPFGTSVVNDLAKDFRKVTKVDMDEFVRADREETLRTVGVSTCTAVIATYPGKFGYLAHISPYDKVYGGDGTNLLGSVIKKIKTYDIYKYERPRVRFFVVARHNDSLSAIVDKLLEEGFLLSQIRVMHGPADHYANVTYDYSEDWIRVEWVSGDGLAASQMQYAHNGHNLGEFVRQLIAEESRLPETRGSSRVTSGNRDYH